MAGVGARPRPEPSLPASTPEKTGRLNDAKAAQLAFGVLVLPVSSSPLPLSLVLSFRSGRDIRRFLCGHRPRRARPSRAGSFNSP